jgi:hypothetical protein
MPTTQPPPVSYRLPVNRPGDTVSIGWLAHLATFAARVTETHTIGGRAVVTDVPIGGHRPGLMTFRTTDDLLAVVDPFVDIPPGFATQLRLDQAQPQPFVRPAGGRGGQTAAHHHRPPGGDLTSLPTIVVEPPPFPSGPQPPAALLPGPADRQLTAALLRAYQTAAGADLFDLGRRAWLLGFTSSGTAHDTSALATFARAALDRPDLTGSHAYDSAGAAMRGGATIERVLQLAVATAGRRPNPAGRPIAELLSDLSQPGTAPASAARYLGVAADLVVTTAVRAIQPGRLTVPYRAFITSSAAHHLGPLPEHVAGVMYARGVQAGQRAHTDGLPAQVRHQIAALLNGARVMTAATAAFPRPPDRRLASLGSGALVDSSRPPPIPMSAVRSR